MRLLVAGALVCAFGASAQAERDYEAEARALYADQPEFEQTWPIEFHLRVIEGVTQDIERAFYELGGGLDRLADEEAAAALRALIAPFEIVERASFVAKMGTVVLDGFDATVAMEISGLAKDGLRRISKGRGIGEFRRTSRGWRLTRLESVDLELKTSAGLLFADVTRAWLDEDVLRAFARPSASDMIHRDLVDGRGTSLQPVAMDAHPGVAVIDFDGDGWEDLAVWDVQGPVTYLRNNSGRFERAELGPPLRDVTSIVSADLDNDGGSDLIFGRFFAPSAIYWRGADNRFALDPTSFPDQVASVAIADVDHDGLLDVFFATADHAYHGRPEGHVVANASLHVDANVGRVGPPNALFRNAGERAWQDVTASAGVGLLRSTLQAAFWDTDADGFPELLVANDFAPAAFYRNRGGRFVDASVEAGIDGIFFGMGISIGDANGDEFADFFVSAMSSSAGRRVVGDGSGLPAHLEEWNRRARALAHRGNTLLVGDGAGLRDASSGVREANWAYGGIFVDADADGAQDIYVPNGFLTSSLEAAGTARDL